jgi:hypothetical protein
MPLAKRLWHEDLDRLAHGFRRCHPEEGCRGGVPENDSAGIGVAHDDSVTNLPEELAHAEVIGS